MNLATATLVFGTGIAGGMMSAMAGGASFFTFPMLLAIGLSPITANASNYVGLTPANLAALPAFRSEIRAIGSSIWPSLASCTLGGLSGALLLMATAEATFKQLVPVLLLVATVMFALGPKVRAAAVARGHTGFRSGSLTSLGVIYLLSVYGGYFGAGVGMMFLSALSVFGYDDIHEANAVKNILIAAMSLVAVGIYGVSGAIAWPEALTLMAGATAGGYLGGKASRRIPQAMLRVGIVCIGFTLSLYYMVKFYGPA